MMEVAYMHNLLPKETYEGWRDNECKLYFREVFPTEFKEECHYVVDQFYKNIEKINIYDIYRSPYIALRGEEKGKVMVDGEEFYYD